jgi:hypothetical protein
MAKLSTRWCSRALPRACRGAGRTRPGGGHRVAGREFSCAGIRCKVEAGETALDQERSVAVFRDFQELPPTSCGTPLRRSMSRCGGERQRGARVRDNGTGPPQASCGIHLAQAARQAKSASCPSVANWRSARAAAGDRRRGVPSVDVTRRPRRRRKVMRILIADTTRWCASLTARGRNAI